jgi:hypothetical protein
MEYVAGQSLGAAIAGGARLSWEQVAGIGAKIADALAHAHAAGIVHRDLKPDNVLLSGDRVLVTDFGIARMVDAASRLTSTGTVMGTPHYMAPEQLEGTQAGAAADMWSLGATMYAAVEGTLPFDGPTLTAIITAILARDPAPPAHAGPLATMLSRLLVKDPAQRPGAAAMALELSATTAAASAFGGSASASAPSGGAPSVAAPSVAARSAHPVTVASPPAGVPAVPYPATMSAPPPQPWAYPAQPPPAGLTPQPGSAPWAYPGQAPPGSRPNAVPGQDGLAVAGLILAIVSSAAYLAGQALTLGAPGKSAAFGYVNDLLPLIVAVIALAGRGVRGQLLPFVLGATFVSLALVAFDVLSIPGYHVLSADRGTHARVSFLASLLGDVIGAVTAIILLIAVRRIYGRGHWATPRVIPALLLAGTVLSWVAWGGVWAFMIAEQHSSFVSFLSGDYPFAVFTVAGVAVTVIAALCALGLGTRPAGGVMLVGWTVTMFLYFAQIITGGSITYQGLAVAGNVAAALLMLGTAVLAITYASRR